MNLGLLSASSFHFGTRFLPASRTLLRPRTLCALCVSAFSGFSLFPFNFKLSTFNLPATPFPAAHTSPLQIAENANTLSPAFATLTDPAKYKPFVCHSYKKHPGWGPAIVTFFVAPTSVCALLRRPTSERSEAKGPRELKHLAVLPVTSRELLAASPLALPLVTDHQSQITKPFRIRTYGKRGEGALLPFPMSEFPATTRVTLLLPCFRQQF